MHRKEKLYVLKMIKDCGKLQYSYNENMRMISNYLLHFYIVISHIADEKKSSIKDWGKLEYSYNENIRMISNYLLLFRIEKSHVVDEKNLHIIELGNQ